jgi:hypothetical protein
MIALVLNLALAATASADEVPAKSPLQSAGRAIPDDNLAYPVRVELKGSQGSGFFINTDTASYFVTAKHVLFNPATNKLFDSTLRLESFPADPTDTHANDFVIDLNVAVTKVHPIEDVVAVKLANVKREENAPAGLLKMEPTAGVTATQVSEKGVVGVNAKEAVTKFNEVKVSNEIYIFGFPNSISLEPLAQIDFQRPLLRKGIVAGLNRAKRTIIIDCESFPGNSGGLVVQVEREVFQNRFRAIGLVVQFVPFDNTKLRVPSEHATILNSGYSVVVPMDAVLELVGSN